MTLPTELFPQVSTPETEGSAITSLSLPCALQLSQIKDSAETLRKATPASSEAGVALHHQNPQRQATERPCLKKKKNTIYIYVCVCVSVCVC